MHSTFLACPPELGSHLASFGAAVGPDAPALAGVIGGAVLLLSGGRMLRPAVGLAGLLAGAVIGAKVLAPELLSRGFDGPGELVGTLGGAAGGCVLALLTFRLLMAVAGGATLGGVALLGSLAYLGISGAQIPDYHRAQDVLATTPIESDEALAYRAAADEAFRALMETRDPRAAQSALASTNPEPAMRAVEHVRSGARAMWDDLSADSRAMISGATLLGCAAGVLLGLAGPRSAAATVCSFAGAGVLIAAGSVFARSHGWMAQDLADMNPGVLMAGWLGLAGMGVWAQSAAARRREERRQNVERARVRAEAAAAAALAARHARA